MSKPLAIILTLLAATPAYAGMHANPITFKLDTIVTYRLQSLSFFLVLTLVLGLFIQWIWNALAKDFPRLPKLTYFKSLALVLLWGLLLALIMSMTTGARELLTPGAWERSGSQYTLTDPVKQSESSRKARLENLGAALLAYAHAHNKQFPSHLQALDVPAKMLHIADDSALVYIYFPGRDIHADDRGTLLAYEPDIFGAERYCLLTTGEVKKLDFAGMLGVRTYLPADTQPAAKTGGQP